MAQYPQRSGEADNCRDYLRTGRCKYGESCKYHHPANVQNGGGLLRVGSPLDPNEPQFPIRPNEPSCPYYLKHGTCKFGSICKFNHPIFSNESKMLTGGTHHRSLPNSPVLTSIQLPKGVGFIGTDYTQKQCHLAPSGRNGNNSIIMQLPATMNLPQRPSEPDCIYFLRNGRCKYGASCKYHHPVTQTVLQSQTQMMKMTPTTGTPLNVANDNGSLVSDQSSSTLIEGTTGSLDSTTFLNSGNQWNLSHNRSYNQRQHTFRGRSYSTGSTLDIQHSNRPSSSYGGGQQVLGSVSAPTSNLTRQTHGVRLPNSSSERYYSNIRRRGIAANISLDTGQQFKSSNILSPSKSDCFFAESHNEINNLNQIFLPSPSLSSSAHLSSEDIASSPPPYETNSSITTHNYDQQFSGGSGIMGCGTGWKAQNEMRNRLKSSADISASFGAKKAIPAPQSATAWGEEDVRQSFSSPSSSHIYAGSHSNLNNFSPVVHEHEQNILFQRDNEYQNVSFDKIENERFVSNLQLINDQQIEQVMLHKTIADFPQWPAALDSDPSGRKNKIDRSVSEPTNLRSFSQMSENNVQKTVANSPQWVPVLEPESPSLLQGGTFDKGQLQSEQNHELTETGKNNLDDDGLSMMTSALLNILDTTHEEAHHGSASASVSPSHKVKPRHSEEKIVSTHHVMSNVRSVRSSSIHSCLPGQARKYGTRSNSLPHYHGNIYGLESLFEPVEDSSMFTKRWNKHECN